MKTFPNLSIETSMVIALMKKAEIGETIPYDKIFEACGKNPQTTGRGYVQTARTRLLNDDGIVFGCVREVGYKRLSDDEIVDLPEIDRKKIHRTVNRGAKKLTGINDYESLSASDKLKHNVGATMYGLLSRVSKKKTINRLMDTVKTNNSPIPSADVLKYLNG